MWSGIPERIKRLMRKWIRSLCVMMTAVLLAMGMCGCAMATQVDLTEEQSKLVAEYAAGLLRKYDQNTTSLQTFTEETLREEPEEEVVEEEVQEEEPQEEETSEPDVEELMDDYTEPIDDAVPEAPVYEYSDSIADAVGVDGFDIQYTDYEVCDSYPKSEEGSWSISMSARRGRKLVVLHFNITNMQNEEAECDILHAGKSYRLFLNDNRINEQVTVLLNSLSQYSDTIPAGVSEDTILIFEAPSEEAESIETMDLLIKDANSSDRFKIQ